MIAHAAPCAVRYKQTALGAAWAIMQPLLHDGRVQRLLRPAGRPAVRRHALPGLHATAALVPWPLFAFALTQSRNSLVATSPLITKVYFPRLLVPLAAVIAGLVDLAHRVRRPARHDGVVRRRAAAGGAAAAAAGPARDRHGARRRALALRAQRAVPRRPLHRPIPDAVLAVRHSGRLPSSLVPEPWRPLYGAQPDGRAWSRASAGRCSGTATRRDRAAGLDSSRRRRCS